MNTIKHDSTLYSLANNIITCVHFNSKHIITSAHQPHTTAPYANETRWRMVDPVYVHNFVMGFAIIKLYSIASNESADHHRVAVSV